METINKDKKKIALITSYFLSRCDQKAVKALGYKNFTEAFNAIAIMLDDKPSNIKNMRDEFDPYFENRRVGWYQRTMSASRKEIFDELKKYSDAEVEALVKKLLGMVKGGANMEETDLLKDLGALIRQSTIHYNQNFMWQDVELRQDFKDAYEEYLSRIKWKIEYFNSTSVITTPTTKNIFVPNQWFVIASYAVGVYSELHRYKGYFERVTEHRHEKMDSYAKQLRDSATAADRVAFMDSCREVLTIENERAESTEKAAKRLWRFATDYSWWSGQKTVDRGDFYLSVVLNMLNLVNASQGYVGDIVNAYGSDCVLRELTKTLDGFTTNMEGETYDITVQEDSYTEPLLIETVSTNGIPTKHKITISAKSIEKMGGK